jgi:hypothetical protein
MKICLGLPVQYLRRSCVNLMLCQGKTLPQSLTQEMTSGEMKFHLECEALLNLVPQPEYRYSSS